MDRATRRAVAALIVAAAAGSQEVFAQPMASSVLVAARPGPSEPLRFFGGRTVRVPLLVHAADVEGLSVRAELVQLSSSLAAPVAGEIEVPVVAATQSTTGPASEIELSVPLPAVSRETDFELRFRSFHLPERVARAAGRVALRVYPADLLEPVRVWAESHAIRLEDQHGSVTELFRQQRVAVTQSGQADLTVYAASQADRARTVPRHGGDQAAILFVERQTASPHLVVDRIGRRTTVSIEMHLLDRLATDPLAQKIFLEAFQHAAVVDHEAAAHRSIP
jgi:hypothetical protein